MLREVDMREQMFLNALLHISDIGPVSIRLLRNTFGSYEAAWRAPANALDGIGLKPMAVQALVKKRPHLDPQRLAEQLSDTSLTIISDADTEYPAVLREIPNPPVALFVRGTLIDRSATTIAVVGTR